MKIRMKWLMGQYSPIAYAPPSPQHSKIKKKAKPKDASVHVTPHVSRCCAAVLLCICCVRSRL